MPELEANGVTLHYELTGAGPQTILFLHGLFFSGEMWRRQVAAFASTHRCLTIDFRGQGASPLADGAYDMDSLSRDVVAVVEQLGTPVHLVAASMGGYVGLRVAARHPSLLHSLTLIATSAEPEPAERLFNYRIMAQVGRLLGFRLVVDPLMRLLFGPSFLADPVRAGQRDHWRARLLANNRQGMALAMAGALERRGVTEDLPRIHLPTLVMVGEEDTTSPPERSRQIHDAIHGSRLLTVPAAGHALVIEQPETVNKALRSFLYVEAAVV